MLNITTAWQRCTMASCLTITCLLAGCDSGPPPPLPPDAQVPAPDDRSRFEPETLAAFDAAQEQVRQLPNADNWSQLGRVYQAHQQLGDAIASYQAAIDAGDETNRTAHLLALALDETGDRPGAQASLQRASALAPTHSPTFWRLAQWQLEAGDLQEAMDTMNEALQTAPEDPSTLQAAGKLLIDVGRPGEAIQPLVSLVRIAPSNSYARYLLGTALMQIGRETEGNVQLGMGRGGKPIWNDQHVNDLSTLTTGPRADFLRLQIICDQGKPAEALPRLLLLEERLGDDPNYHVQVAKANRMLNRHKSARKSLDSALAISPEHFSANYQLAGLLRDEWRALPSKEDTTILEAALDQVDYVLELNSSNPSSHAVKAQILDDLDRPDESVQSYQQADKLDVENNGFGYLAAQVYLKRSQWEYAVTLLKELQARFPNDWPLRRELGLAQWKAGHVDAAQMNLLFVQQKFPKDTLIAEALLDLQQR